MLYYTLTAASAKGSRKYMEDRMVIKLVRGETNVQTDLFFAILDGHGGPQASEYVRNQLWETIKKTDGFLSSNDCEVLGCMKQAFLIIHYQMREFRDKWPLRANGFPSTAGTTCSCALIRGNKIYTAHCGDSRIVLLTEDDDGEFVSKDLTQDHKPDDEKERQRIEQDGGKICSYTPVARVMWTREVPKSNDDKEMESIPFLSIARSIGDYWSYSPKTGKYVVSPEPDVGVHQIDNNRDKYLVLVSDGITTVLSSEAIAELVDRYRKNALCNISRCILKSTSAAWRNLKADNMSVICIGFHEFAADKNYGHVYDLGADTQIEKRLTSNPQEIILLYSEKTLSTDSDSDGEGSVVGFGPNDDFESEFYSGPGYINQSALESDVIPQALRSYNPPFRRSSRTLGASDCTPSRPLGNRFVCEAKRALSSCVQRSTSSFLLEELENSSPDNSEICFSKCDCPSKLQKSHICAETDDDASDDGLRPIRRRLRSSRRTHSIQITRMTLTGKTGESQSYELHDTWRYQTEVGCTPLKCNLKANQKLEAEAKRSSRLNSRLQFRLREDGA